MTSIVTNQVTNKRSFEGHHGSVKKNAASVSKIKSKGTGTDKKDLQKLTTGQMSQLPRSHGVNQNQIETMKRLRISFKKQEQRAAKKDGFKSERKAFHKKRHYNKRKEACLEDQMEELRAETKAERDAYQALRSLRKAKRSPRMYL